MQVAYPRKMEKTESPRRLRRRQRLIALLEEFGGAAQVARESGTPKSHFSAMASGTRGVGDVLAAKLEALYNKPSGWFDDSYANLTAPMGTLQASGNGLAPPATTAQIMPLVPASYGKSAISLDDTLKSLVRHLDAAGHPDAVAGLLVSLVKSPNDPALLFALKTTLEAFAQQERKEA